MIILMATIFIAACSFVPHTQANTLVIGSTQSFAADNKRDTSQEAPFGDHVREQLAKDPRFKDSGDLVFEDIYREKTLDTAIGGKGMMVPMEYRCHSLAQWFFWPEEHEARLANLRGEGTTKWKFVVLVGDPYIMANMPGVYAEGVKLIADEVRKGTAQPILMMPNADGNPEVVCRVGQGAEIPVVPAELVEKLKEQTTGTFDALNPFAMKYVRERNVTYNHTGTSSERGISGALEDAIKRCQVAVRKTTPKEGQARIDFNYGRANSIFERSKQYKVAPEQFGRSYGFPMQDHAKTGTTTMLYGIDKRYANGRYDDGTDLGIAYDMIRQGEVAADIRCVPIRLMGAKMHHVDSEITPFRDKWHMSRPLDAASGTFIYTLLSGRCSVGTEPPKSNKEAWQAWLGRRIGYETAWRMSHLRSRVPGFCVVPTEKSDAVSPTSPAKLEVQFLYTPTSDVTCRISIEPRGTATVQPTSLRFTPENHATPQTITITSANPSVTEHPFQVIFQTESDDEVYQDLSDAWSFRVEK